MIYKDLLKTLRNRSYRRILVTGPDKESCDKTGGQLAASLKFDWFDDTEIGTDNFDQLFRLYQSKNFVLSAIGLCAYSHMMPGAVVLVKRPVADIINIGDKQRELDKYFRDVGSVPQIKYETWDQWQIDRPNLFDVEYQSVEFDV